MPFLQYLQIGAIPTAQNPTLKDPPIIKASN